MKITTKTATSISFTFFLVFLYKFGFAESLNEIKLVKLTEKIYVVEDSFYVSENSVIYIGENEITVISATWSPETAKILAEKIRSISDKPITRVVNTHHHLDRSGGNIYFKNNGAKIISLKMTSKLMKKKWISMVKNFQKSYPDYPNIPLVVPDITFKNKYEIENGKIQLHYFGPSHTEDGLVVYFPDEKILFGDCILKDKLGNLNDANLKEYPKTLRKIQKLDIKTIIAGHWTAIHGPELIDKVLGLLEKEKTSIK